MNKREHIINILNRIIDVAVEMAKFNKTLIADKQKRTKINKYIKMCEKAKDRLLTIKHEEVLYSIYENVAGKSKISLYTMCPSLIMHKATKHFDTDKGFKEFLKLEEIGKKEEIAKAEEIRKNQEIIAQAKKEGKEVEFVYKDGKMQQIIVDKQTN